MTGQKQVCDIRAGKRMTVAQSNEHLRIGNSSAWNANRAGNLDPTRSHLNFEIGKGGVVKEVDQKTSIPKRIQAIFDRHGIKDPNDGLTDEELKKKGNGRRTHANIILEGSRETMRKLAFGDQQVNFEHGADNSHITRSPEIEKWAKDMYDFFARKYGEENIAAFVVHLDETLPHVHCTLIPIKNGKLSFKKFFNAEDKYEYAEEMKKLHNELAEVNKKWGLERGESVALTGAEHKTYLQWLKEQIDNSKKTIKEQGETIAQQSKEIEAQKQQLYAINAEIRKAQTKLKGLTTMIANLEGQRDYIEAQITALEDDYKNGNEEAIKKMQELNAQLEDFNAKITDKTNKLNETQEQLRELAIRKHQLQNEYTQLMLEKKKEMSNVLDKTQRFANDIFWQFAAEETKKDYSAFEDFANKLPAELRTKFMELMDGSFFSDIAQHGDHMAAVGAALFLGYVDAATNIAQSGGGGGSPGTGWGREKGEDDEAYMLRCCIMGRRMMKFTGRKLKQSGLFRR